MSIWVPAIIGALDKYKNIFLQQHDRDYSTKYKVYSMICGHPSVTHIHKGWCSGARQRAGHISYLDNSPLLPRTKGHTKQPSLSTNASIISAQQADMNSPYVRSPDVASKVGVKVKVQSLIEVAHDKISFFMSVL